MKWYYKHRGNVYGPFGNEDDAIHAGKANGAHFVWVYYKVGKEFFASPNRLAHAIWGQT